MAQLITRRIEMEAGFRMRWVVDGSSVLNQVALKGVAGQRIMWVFW